MDDNLMLFGRGRPTSIVLLLLMVIAELTLSLSRHPPLCLHDLLSFARASWLVALSCVEVLQVRGRIRPGITEIADGVVSRWSSSGAHTRIYSC